MGWDEVARPLADMLRLITVMWGMRDNRVHQFGRDREEWIGWVKCVIRTWDFRWGVVMYVPFCWP